MALETSSLPFPTKSQVSFLFYSEIFWIRVSSVSSPYIECMLSETEASGFKSAVRFPQEVVRTRNWFLAASGAFLSIGLVQQPLR